MRFWLYFFTLLSIIGVLVFAFWYFSAPVEIRYQGWVISPTVPVLLFTWLLLTAILILVMKAVFFIILLPFHLVRWRGNRRDKNHYKAMVRVLRALAYEDNPRLLRELTVLIPTSESAL